MSRQQYSLMYIRCFDRLMGLEGWGEAVNHPDDPGKLTKYGISKLAYPDEDIANLTIVRAMFLYKRDYWDPLRCDDLNDEEIIFQLFEAAVHMDAPQHPVRSVKIAQGALLIHSVKVDLDGIMGPQTLKALNTYRYKDSLLKWMNILQGASLLVGKSGEDELIMLIRERLHQLQTFGRGWGRRIEV